MRRVALLLLLLLARAALAGEMARYVAQLKADAQQVLTSNPSGVWERKYEALYRLIESGDDVYVAELTAAAMGMDWVDLSADYGTQSVVLVPWARACARTGSCSTAVQLAVLSHFVDGDVTNVEAVFQLCRLWDQEHEFDLAMHYCHQAKATLAAAFDNDDVEKPFVLMDALLNTQPFRDLPVLPPPPPGAPRPVFIVGIPRTGSTLLEQMLSMLPGVHCVGEAKVLDRFALEEVQATSRADPSTASFADIWRPLYGDFARFAARVRAAFLLPEVAEPPQDPARLHAVVEKTLTNFMYVPLLARMLPDAVFLETWRDARDVAISMYTILFDEYQENLGYTLAPDSIGRFVAAYIEFMAAVRADPAVAGRIVTVNYEDLVVNPENTLRTVTDAIGIEFDPSSLRFHESARNPHTASNDQVRRPLHSGSIGRWRGYAAYMHLFQSPEGGWRK